jgi:hypothetical protein
MLGKEIIENNGKQVMLEILNGNDIQVSTTNCSVDIDANGIIREVVFNGVASYKLQEKIAVNINGVKHSYNITRITKISDTSFIINHTIPTKTKHFLLPALGDYELDFSYNALLINCYLKLDNNSIVLVYRFIPTTQYNLLDKYLRTSELYVTTTNNSYTTVAYEMKIPTHYSKDVTKFLEGKYSELSDRLKKRILSFHKLNLYGETAKILYKDSELRKQLEIELGLPLVKGAELHSIPVLLNELYQPTLL